jgi:KDO2-lipid IV(A) lauroyltransferase
VAATLAHRLEYAALRGFMDALAPLGPRAAGRVAGAIARLAYSPLGIRKGVVQRQIAAAFPHLGRDEIGRIARESYTNLGRVAVEAILLSRGGANAVLGAFGPSPGWELVERARSLGRGVIIVSGHLGNWELSGAYVAARGVPLHAIARGMANPLSDAFFRRTREHLGMHIMHDRDAVRRIPRVLRDGHAVGILSDQATVGLASTFVPFFGRPAKTPRGAAVFALRFGVPVLYAQAVRQADGRYEWVAEEIALTRSDNREYDTDEITARFSEALERMVRRYPGQYFWQHRRWKHQPADTPAALREP